VQKRYARPLHSIIVVCLVFKTGYDLFKGALYFTCSGSSVPYWEIAVDTCFTLYNTFAYTSLLLISKGFGITQTVLSRSDVTTSAMTMGLVYLCISAVMISPDRMLLLWFVMLLSLFYFIVRNSLHNLQVLRGRLLELLRLSLPSDSLKLRVSMMTRFLVSVYLFFLAQLFISVIFDLALTVGSTLNTTGALVGTVLLQVSILTALASIFAIFRARDLGPTYSESLLADDVPCREVPVYSAKVDWQADQSAELSNDKEAPIVVVPPQDTNCTRVLVGIEVGAEASRHSTRASWTSNAY
jgi:hypothetical protein